jgi:hypothetical protein
MESQFRFWPVSPGGPFLIKLRKLAIALGTSSFSPSAILTKILLPSSGQSARQRFEVRLCGPLTATENDE